VSRPARLRKIVAVETVLVVHLTLLRVGEHVVGFLKLLELFFRGFVTGIEVGMVFARQLAERRTNILGAGFPRYSQQFVIVLFRCRCHDGAAFGAKLIRIGERFAGVRPIMPLQSSLRQTLALTKSMQEEKGILRSFLFLLKTCN